LLGFVAQGLLDMQAVEQQVAAFSGFFIPQRFGTTSRWPPDFAQSSS